MEIRIKEPWELGTILYPYHTVDGSEIPFPTTWDGAETL